MLESPTWRANPRWAEEIGHSREELDVLNRRAIDLMAEIRERHGSDAMPIVISGCIGPHADAYRPDVTLTAEAARDYHATQIATFADTAADMVTRAHAHVCRGGRGIAHAAADHGLPVAISFTVETDGRLPSGQDLADAIRQVDDETAGALRISWSTAPTRPTSTACSAPASPGRSASADLRANASTKSHAELDEAEELDEGDPVDLGARYAALAETLPWVNVLGGCCGTDQRHIAAIAEAWPGA